MKKGIYRIFIILNIILLFRILFYKIKTNPIIIIADKNNEEIGLIINNNKSSTIDIKLIPKNNLNLILKIEDNNFYTHKGYSLKSLIRALKNTILFKPAGGSTITEQMIKNIYLDNKKTISRKIKEIILARKIEHKLTKDEILALYLSSNYFGNNIYGLANASKYYYNKNYNELTENEMLELIALWNAPSIYSKDLKKWNNKKITLINSYKLSIPKIPINLNINKNYQNSNRLYYLDYVIKEFNNDFNIKSKLFDNIIIKTCYDKNTEKITTKVDCDISLISINKEGYITTLIGNKDYNDSNYNIGIYSKRDIGSTIKPILYYELIKCGYNNQIFKSEPYSYTYKDVCYTVSNSNNNYYGNIDLKTAIAVSDNIYAMKSHFLLGMNTLAYHLKKYGIEATPTPSLALGSIPITLKKLTEIYSQFFTEGNYLNIKAIKEITTDKTIINNIKIENLNDKEICKEIKKLLLYPFSNIPNATCRIIKNEINDTVYGKSGLTDYDSYMVGFTENNLVSVWCGHKDGKKLKENEIKKLPKKLFSNTLNLINPSSTNKNNQDK